VGNVEPVVSKPRAEKAGAVMRRAPLRPQERGSTFAPPGPEAPDDELELALDRVLHFDLR